VDKAFLQVVVFINRETNGDRSDVFPRYFVFFDDGFVGSTSVLGGCGGGEMPFYVGGSTD
jgi:hypothetical protein